MTVDALFVDAKRGPYPGLVGLDHCWDETRDARLYKGPGPVIVHPPCGRWCSMAKLNERRWGARVGEDSGCFAAALKIVRRFGGVLEHPARSLAWAHFWLQAPKAAGWTRVAPGEWVCEVWQSAYGHVAAKRTWLLYVGPQPIELNWRRERGTHQIGGGVHTGNRLLPRCPSSQAHLTPLAFAEVLVALAKGSR
jgi:hypothetical protein